MSNVVAISQLPPNSPGETRRAPASHRIQLQAEDLQTLKENYGKDLTDSEFRLFVAIAQERGLNPLNRQIHAIVRGKGNKRTLTFQTSIDAFRLIGQRSGQYVGQTPVEWCGPDGQWREIWCDNNPPVAARVGVYRQGFVAPIYGVANYGEYVQYAYSEGGPARPNSMWTKMPASQLAKCAEALALRKTFAEELSGFYTSDEMGQAANNPAIEATAVETPRQRSQQQPAPSPEPKTYAPNQQYVGEWINELTTEQRGELKAWWVVQQLGRLDTLTLEEVEVVEARLAAFGDGEKAPAEDTVIDTATVDDEAQQPDHHQRLRDEMRRQNINGPERWKVIKEVAGVEVRGVDALTVKEAQLACDTLQAQDPQAPVSVG